MPEKVLYKKLHDIHVLLVKNKYKEENLTTWFYNPKPSLFNVYFIIGHLAEHPYVCITDFV